MDEWPEDSVKVFLDDALYSRYWVDHELSQLFVRNVKTIVETEERPGKQQSADVSNLVRRRFHGAKMRQDMRDLIINHIRARLTELEKEKGGNGGPGGSSANAMRNVILTLADFVSLSKARVLAAENMDTWLQNPSVKPASRELLNKIAAVSQHSLLALACSRVCANAKLLSSCSRARRTMTMTGARWTCCSR